MDLNAPSRVFGDQHAALLESLRHFLRMPTISAQPAHAGDLTGCAAWLAERLNAAGLSARVVETGGHPAVLADTGPDTVAAGAPTLLFYGHYDVQPIGDENLWETPAFEPTERDGILYARGSADDKGQLMTHLAAVDCWHRANPGMWPARLKFLIEGEEEIGSPHLPELIRRRADDLACDYVVISDTSKHDADTPALTCATRGLVYKQITLDGPSRDLHSGQYGGTVANPANVLAGLIASLRDEANRVTIPGFYDDVIEPSTTEREAIARTGMSEADLLQATGSPAPSGEAGWTTSERFGVRPSLDVNGFVSGYIGEGAATIIPSRARAKVSMRLVAAQDPDRISSAFDEAVRAACPDTVRLSIETFGCCAAYRAPVDSPGMRAAARALERAYGRAPVVVHEGGTLPILPLFKSILGADSLMLGFADPDCNLHSPNEFFALRDFDRGTQAILSLLADAAAISP